MRIPSGTLRIAAVLVAAWACLSSAAAARAEDDGVTPATSPVEVKVELLRPKRIKHPTLRFLRANRDFIRSRLDLLREKPIDGSSRALAVDPRFLEYRELVAAVLFASDSVASADDARQRRTLFASVTDLGALEDQLDLMERQLTAQRERLGLLQADFTGHQRTELVVVAKGFPAGALLDSIAITLESGGTMRVPVDAPQRQALQTGAILEVFHGMVEPRDQVVEVRLIGATWPVGQPGYLSLVPPRDRLTFLQLDLSTMAPKEITGIRATTWLMEAGPFARESAEARP